MLVWNGTSEGARTAKDTGISNSVGRPKGARASKVGGESNGVEDVLCYGVIPVMGSFLPSLMYPLSCIEPGLNHVAAPTRRPPRVAMR
jgi:hypothetical protein